MECILESTLAENPKEPDSLHAMVCISVLLACVCMLFSFVLVLVLVEVLVFVEG